MKYFILSIIIGFCFTMVSCKKFLDTHPANYSDMDTYFKDFRDVEGAVTGCYNALLGIKKSNEFLYNDDRSDDGTYPHTDNITSNTDAYYPTILNVAPANDYVNNYWGKAFQLISRVNMVLSKLDVVTIEEKKKQYEAELKFLRAWCYFNLVRYFGDVPLLTKPITSAEALEIAKTPKQQVYEQIVNDLSESYDLLNSLTTYTAKYGQVNKWAAQALLGKVYLTMGDKEKALAPLENVYTKSPYTLIPNYGDLFVVAKELTEASKEVLFSIRFKGGGLGLGNNFSTDAAAVKVSNFGSNRVFYTNLFLNSFVTTSDTTLDKRYKIICGEVPGSYSPTTGPFRIVIRYIPKAVGLVSNGTDGYKTDILTVANDGDLDWPDLRFADVALMLAEVRGQNGGLEIINRVRARSSAPLLTVEKINTVFNGSFQEAVLNERRIELAFEGNRLFDLLRMGDSYATAALYKKYTTEPAYSVAYPETNTLVTQMTSDGKIDAWRLLLPLPLNQLIISNALIQNPGYPK